MMMVPRRNGFDIFDEVFNDPFFTKKESKLMKTDVREKDGNYVLDIDLPGYDKNDIKIELTDGYLTVTASRTEHKEEKEQNKSRCKTPAFLWFHFYLQSIKHVQQHRTLSSLCRHAFSWNHRLLCTLRF